LVWFVLFRRASLIIEFSLNPKFQPLRRSRHPNILRLYGYSLNANQAQQYLVFEHAAKGPLNGFLNADCKRTQLTALIRISIIYELTTAVQCLHNGGCFHRDIQSANIWLSHDYTAQLMDCRLATFVPIGSNTACTMSAVVNPLSPTGAIEYICPEYLNNTDSGHYEAAYDMYAVGVVMVELILGYLIGGPSSRDGTNGFSVFRDCVQDDEGKQITNGFELLKQHADRSILWNSESLDLLCKAAIRCLTPPSSPMGTMSTIELLAITSQAMHTNFPIECHNHVVSNYEFSKCEICKRYCHLRRCHAGHAMCRQCIETKICQIVGNVSHEVAWLQVCPAKDCTSHDDYLFGYISPKVIQHYWQIEFDATH
jgi:serine/threonine protein kinase